MKILKTLAVFFVLLALTVGAVAEEYTRLNIGDIEFDFPVGLHATVTQDEYDGHIRVKVDSARTDWETVVAQMDHWGEVPFFIGSSDPTAQGLGNLFSTYKGEVTDWADSVMKPLYEQGFGYLVNDIKANRTLSLGGVNTLMNYSASTNTIVPRTYNKNSGQWLFYLEAHCDNNKNITAQKYCVITVEYTDPSARKVGLNNVPVSRIEKAEDAAVKEINPGSVEYELENGHSENGKNVVAGITPPAKAKSFMHNAGEYTVGVTDGKPEIRVWAGPKNAYNSQVVTFFWYDGEPDPQTGAPTGNYLGAERIAVSVYVGGAKPWPNYVSEDDTVAVSGGDLSLDIWNSATGAKGSFASLTYDGGTVTVKRNTAKSMPNDDLTDYVLRQTIKAPDQAAYYSYSDYAYAKSSFIGSSYVSRFDSIKEELADPESILKVTDGEVVFEDNLFRSATYSGDAGLKTYYDWNSTENDCGDIIFVQWYDEAGNPLGIPQWYVIQYKTMAQTEEKDIESDIPADAEEPTLVTTADASGYTFKVTNYPQYSESGTQIHYELEVLDSNGVLVDLDDLPKGEYTLFIPFPDDITDTNIFGFTVNHYNADGTKVVESANEEGTAKIALERNGENTGVYMTVTSLSPFVLSWETTDVDVSALPSTGDNSLPLVALMGMLALAVTGSFMLRKKANA